MRACNMRVWVRACMHACVPVVCMCVACVCVCVWQRRYRYTSYGFGLVYDICPNPFFVPDKVIKAYFIWKLFSLPVK